MPILLGYGEDSITYWALTNKLQSILQQLEDDSDQDKCLLFYRPSFGRKGKHNGKDDSSTSGPQFGEFDAIIATPKAIYLIESKWNKSNKKKSIPYRVEKRQRWRHRVMREYIANWQKARATNTSWKEFLDIPNDRQFSILERSYVLPKHKNRLSKNLEFVLTKLQNYGSSVHDVLLYLKRNTDPHLDFNCCDGFRLVTIEYSSQDNFVALGSGNDSLVC